MMDRKKAVSKKRAGSPSRRPNKKPKRVYDNTRRSQKSLESQKLILEATVALLVERKGGEATFEEVAERSGISERSIFRFFKDKQALHEEMDRYLISYLSQGHAHIENLDVPGFAKKAYELFDQHEALTLAYLYSRFGLEARGRFRRELNKSIIAQILKKKPVPMNSENKKKLAIIVSLINAKIWHDVREDFGFSGRDIGDSVQWAIKALIEKL